MDPNFFLDNKAQNILGKLVCAKSDSICAILHNFTKTRMTEMAGKHGGSERTNEEQTKEKTNLPESKTVME